MAKLTFHDAGCKLDLEGLSFNFCSPLCCAVRPDDTMGSRGCFSCLEGEEEEDEEGCVGHLENGESAACEMWLGVDLRA